ncbi:MAG TPA: hypothetical protein PK595_05955 [Bacteroidota bacterium]|nr:hypothetical protein [Bacteroidota bacterium]
MHNLGKLFVLFFQEKRTNNDELNVKESKNTKQKGHTPPFGHPSTRGNNSPSQKGCQPKVDGVVYQAGGFDTSYRSPQPSFRNRLLWCRKRIKALARQMFYIFCCFI